MFDLSSHKSSETFCLYTFQPLGLSVAHHFFSNHTDNLRQRLISIGKLAMMKAVFLVILMLCSMQLWAVNDVNDILQRLIAARGEPRDDYPSVVISDRARSIAAFSPTTNTIILERQAIETCERLNDQAEDALAFLISHELTHFFQHRIWKKHSTDEISFFATKERLQKVRQFEIEADRYGAFLCYLAGYNYYEIAPKIIKALYESYQIDPTTLSQYPLPAERMELTQSVCGQVKEYALFFEAARVLAHFGAYQWSHAMHTYLLRYLDFQEIYVNAGANQLKWFLANHEEAMTYPIRFKQGFSLRGGLHFSLDSLLSLAESNTLHAINKDPGEYPAFVNLGLHLLAQRRFGPI